MRTMFSSSLANLLLSVEFNPPPTRLRASPLPRRLPLKGGVSLKGIKGGVMRRAQSGGGIDPPPARLLAYALILPTIPHYSIGIDPQGGSELEGHQGGSGFLPLFCHRASRGGRVCNLEGHQGGGSVETRNMQSSPSRSRQSLLHQSRLTSIGRQTLAPHSRLTPHSPSSGFRRVGGQSLPNRAGLSRAGKIAFPAIRGGEKMESAIRHQSGLAFHPVGIDPPVTPESTRRNR